MNYNFNVEIATKIGVDEAIMLNNFVYWLLKNKANNKNFFDGNYWTFNSVRAYSELFPFWKESQIKRILKSLIDQNVLVVGNYNQNAYDRTNWYSLSNEYIYLIDWTISTNGKAENSQPIPDNKPNNKTNNINYDEFLLLWNEFATKNKKPEVAKLSDSRKKKILARLKDFKDFKDFKVAFEVALKKANESYFLLNSSFFTFDWLVENDTNILKVLEDKYKDKYNPNNNDEWSDGSTRCDPNEYR